VSEFLLYTGCLIPARFPQAESSARFILNALKADVADAKGLSCCPDPVMFRSASEDDWLTIAAANLAKAATQGKKLLTICSGCYETFVDACFRLEDADVRAEVNKRLTKAGLRYDGGIEVVHFARFLEQNINAVKERIKGEVLLRAALFYGCHILKPSSLMKPDSLRFPRFLHPVAEVCGVELVEWDGSRCCGMGSAEADVGKVLSDAVVSAAKEAGADALIVVCPFCFAGLEGVGRLPVLFLQQVVAAAMGAPKDVVGLALHRVKTEIEVREHVSA